MKTPGKDKDKKNKGKGGKPAPRTAPPPPKQPALPDVPADILAVRSHLMNHFGNPAGVVEFKKPGLATSAVQRMEVARFSMGNGATSVFATVGASQAKMTDGRRMEAYLLTRGEPDKDKTAAINSVMAALALYPERNKVALGAGAVIQSPDDIKTFSAMDAVLLLPPLQFVPGFHEFKRQDGAKVEIFWMLPIYASEAEIALKKGPMQLYKLFADQQVDVSDLSRPAVDPNAPPKPPPAPPKAETPAAKGAPAKPGAPAAKPGAPAAKPGAVPAKPGAPAGAKPGVASAAKPGAAPAKPGVAPGKPAPAAPKAVAPVKK
ncbi:MAG: suppressor of fused domain protein [Myxococcota bacterium]